MIPKKFWEVNRFIPVDKLFLQQQRERFFNTWFDKLTFGRVLLVWVGIIILFGIIYYIVSTSHSVLIYGTKQEPTFSILDAIYFSFITATSTGYGDIVPQGFLRVVAIVEVIFGLILLAFVTSKFVSIKQDLILGEIYEISFNEQINRLRSSLLLFRQHLNKIIERVEHNVASKREVGELYHIVSSFEDTLQEIIPLLERKKKYKFMKGMDAVDAELIFNSTTQSFEKLKELLELLNKNNIPWKRDVTLHSISKCLEHSGYLSTKLKESNILSEKIVAEISKANGELVEFIRKEL